MRGVSKNVVAVLFVGLIFSCALPVAATTWGNAANLATRKMDFREFIKTEEALYAEALTFAGAFYSNKGFYINMNGLLSDAMGQKELNGVYKLQNDALVLKEHVQVHPTAESLEYSMERIARLSEKMQGQYYYFQVPDKLALGDGLLYPGQTESTTALGEQVKVGLLEKGVCFIDLLDWMKEDGITADGYYQTDHHWTTGTGFWAFQKICRLMLQNGGGTLCIDSTPYIDTRNYRIDSYPGVFTGSSAMRTGIYFGGLDDLDLILPRFQTSFTHSDTKETGDFTQTFLNMDSLHETEPRWLSAYGRVLMKGYAIGKPEEGIRYQNNDANAIKKRILVITDSTGRAVVPYMACAFSDVYWVWTYSRLTDEMIEAFAPDAIVEIRFTPSIVQVPYR